MNRILARPVEEHRPDRRSRRLFGDRYHETPPCSRSRRDPRRGHRLSRDGVGGTARRFGAEQQRTRRLCLGSRYRKDWQAGWADARISGDLVYVSGVIVAPVADDPANLQLAFARIEKTLSLSGSSIDGIVEITAYLTDVTSQTPALDKARLAIMRPLFAASTVVQVVRLIPDNAIGKIRVVARVTRASGQ